MWCLWCVVCVCVRCGVVGGRGVSLVCGTLKNRGKNRMWIPTRLRVHIQNVPVCTGTTSTCFSVCARGAGTHGDVLNVHTEAFRKYTQGRFERTRGVITCPSGSPNNRRISPILRIGRAQSLNAPLLPVAIYLSYETGTLFRQGPPHDETATTRREHDTNNDARHTT